MPGKGLGIVIEYGLGPGRLYEMFEKLYCLHQEHLAVLKSLLGCLLASIKVFNLNIFTNLCIFYSFVLVKKVVEDETKDFSCQLSELHSVEYH